MKTNEELMQWLEQKSEWELVEAHDIRELFKGMRLVPEALQPSGDAPAEHHKKCTVYPSNRLNDTPDVCNCGRGLPSPYAPSGDVVSVPRDAVLFAIDSMRATDNVLQHYAPHAPEAKLSTKMIGQLESALSSTVSDGKEG